MTRTRRGNVSGKRELLHVDENLLVEREQVAASVPQLAELHRETVVRGGDVRAVEVRIGRAQTREAGDDLDGECEGAHRARCRFGSPGSRVVRVAKGDDLGGADLPRCLAEADPTLDALVTAIPRWRRRTVLEVLRERRA